MISDMLLVAGALGAAAYCFVLSRRLRAFARLEGGMGGAIAVMSVQVDDLTRALTTAQATAAQSARSLAEMTDRSEQAARRLELLMASLHDLPEIAEGGGTGGGTGGAPRPRVLRRRREGRMEAAG